MDAKNAAEVKDAVDAKNAADAKGAADAKDTAEVKNATDTKDTADAMKNRPVGLPAELDEIDRKLINLIQLRFPVSKHPFEEIAAEIGTTEDIVISKLTRLKNEGVVRRIGPIINTRGIGGTNTLAAVKVPDNQIEKAAAVINKYAEVSHNYLRNENYNIWFTVSAPTQERLDLILSEIQTELDCPLLNLPTVKQFKIQVNFHV